MGEETYAGVYISPDSVIEEGARIFPPAHVINSRICAGAQIMPFSYVENSRVGENSRVISSTVTNSVICSDCTVGPYAYLRQNAYVGEGCRIGDFVEIKNSTLGKGCRAAHLSYIGDATLGERVNVGCGAVFCNYDGFKKHSTVVGDGVFIGANSNLIAPLTIGGGAFIAAGTTVSSDLKEGDFCIGRQRERILPEEGAKRYENSGAKP